MKKIYKVFLLIIALIFLSTFNPNTLHPYIHGTRRKGPPKKQWSTAAVQAYWKLIQPQLPIFYRDEEYDPLFVSDIQHVKEQAALQRYSNWYQSTKPSRK